MLKALLAFAMLALSWGCEPSALVPGGCRLAGDDDSGVDVHYALSRNASLVSFALQAETRGYVAIGFVRRGQDAMFPADAVVGWAGESDAVMGYAVNGYEHKDIVGSGVLLTNTSAAEANGTTTVRFTRLTRTGRFPIDPAYVTFNLAQGATDGLSRHTKESTVAANLLTGKRLPLVPRAPVAYLPPFAPPGDAPPPVLPIASPPSSHASAAALGVAAAAFGAASMLVF